MRLVAQERKKKILLVSDAANLMFLQHVRVQKEVSEGRPETKSNNYGCSVVDIRLLLF